MKVYAFDLLPWPEDGVEAPVLGDEQRGGHTVELAGGVMLQLAVRGDLPLQLHEVFGPAIHLDDDLEPERRRGRSAGQR